MCPTTDDYNQIDAGLKREKIEGCFGTVSTLVVSECVTVYICAQEHNFCKLSHTLQASRM
jgi:hypothetical protein